MKHFTKTLACCCLCFITLSVYGQQDSSMYLNGKIHAERQIRAYWAKRGIIEVMKPAKPSSDKPDRRADKSKAKSKKYDYAFDKLLDLPLDEITATTKTLNAYLKDLKVKYEDGGTQLNEAFFTGAGGVTVDPAVVKRL